MPKTSPGVNRGTPPAGVQEHEKLLEQIRTGKVEDRPLKADEVEQPPVRTPAAVKQAKKALNEPEEQPPAVITKSEPQLRVVVADHQAETETITMENAVIRFSFEVLDFAWSSDNASMMCIIDPEDFRAEIKGEHYDFDVTVRGETFPMMFGGKHTFEARKITFLTFWLRPDTEPTI